jgi:hypothetical protein
MMVARAFGVGSAAIAESAAESAQPPRRRSRSASRRAAARRRTHARRSERTRRSFVHLRVIRAVVVDRACKKMVAVRTAGSEWQQEALPQRGFARLG